MVKEIAYGRVGLLGNPSDIYGGKTLSIAIGDYAWTEILPSDRFSIQKGERTKTIDYDLDYRVDNGFGNNNLVKATLRHMKLEERIRDDPIKIIYDSDIPIGSGLSGSSAIIISLIKSLNRHYSLGLDDKRDVAELALHVETDELNISAGFQDRYVISHSDNPKAVIFMDFTGKELLRKAPDIDPYGKIEVLDVPYIPLFISGGAQPKSSAITHNPLRELFLRGYNVGATPDEKMTRLNIKSDLDAIGNLAVLGKEAILNGDWDRVIDLVNMNHSLREGLKSYTKSESNHLPKDREMIERAIEGSEEVSSCKNSRYTIGAKVAGSGGAIVVVTRPEKFEDIFKKMRTKYLSMTLPISESD